MAEHAIGIFMLYTSSLIKSLYDSSVFVAFNNSFTFWWMLQTQKLCVPAEPARTHHFGFKQQNFENPNFTSGYSHLKQE